MNNPTKERVDKFIEDFKKEKLTQKYLYKYTWLSGSSTTVYPIAIWGNVIIFQWRSSKKIFNKFISRIVKENADLFSRGSFWKSDGSCPSTINFYFKSRG